MKLCIHITVLNAIHGKATHGWVAHWVVSQYKFKVTNLSLRFQSQGWTDVLVLWSNSNILHFAIIYLTSGQNLLNLQPKKNPTPNSLLLCPEKALLFCLYKCDYQEDLQNFVDAWNIPILIIGWKKYPQYKISKMYWWHLYWRYFLTQAEKHETVQARIY